MVMGLRNQTHFFLLGGFMSDWEAAKQTLFFILESFGDLFDWCVMKFQDFFIFFLVFICACILLGSAIMFIS